MKKIAVILLCSVLFLASCSAAPSETSSSAVMSASENGYEASSDSGAVNEESAAEPESSEESGGLGSLSDPILPETGRKLTYSASLSINTKQYDADYAKINEELSAVGGYVANEESAAYSSDTGKNHGRNSYFSLRIPVDRLNEFLERISGVGEIVSKHKATEDLTSEYYDTEARIEVLELRRERLMSYLETAASTEDIIALEQEISDVLYELDQLQGSKRRMDTLIDYATVDVELIELITPETIGADGKPLGDRASDAFAMSLTGVGEFMENFAVFWAAALPVIILIAIFAAVIYAVIRLILWLRRKYYEKHPERRPSRPVPPVIQQSSSPRQSPGGDSQTKQ
ncbi:DUF4349 domain-containing protein [Christensenella massiliensis]|uniref:DUF4349 domain-containing protein n=1 Tax=Christensenella massiliensis TaxID=1805714 RepID=A0AAU8A8S8_9FIRM